MSGTKLLVVDDEPDAAIILAKTLKARGYEVHTASNGLDAVTMAKTLTPDLILLDILMPGMDGTEVAKALQEDPTTRNIPVIFLTCLVTKKTEQIGAHYHDTTKCTFMSKPYDLDNLLAEIDRLIGARVQ
jgi:CheY-like chemotaxis protein